MGKGLSRALRRPAPGFNLKGQSMNRRAFDAKTLQPLPGVLTEALTQAGLSNLVTLVKVQRNWAAIAGSQLAKVSHPVRFRWGELLVSVSDAIWLHQMTFFQARIRERIRSVVSDEKVSKLRFVLTYSSDQPLNPSSPGEEPRQPQIQTQILTADEERMVRSGTAGISHAGLREAASRAWRQDLLAKR